MALILPVCLYLCRRGAIAQTETPWNPPDAAARQVIILGGLSAFAVTALVLLVTFGRDRAEVRTESFNAVVSMYLIAYLLFVGTAILFAFMPRQDTDGGVGPKIQFSIATLSHYRAVLLGWFALRPLMATFGFDTLADVAGWAVGASLLFGSVLGVAIFVRAGLLSLREACVLPALAGAATGALVVIFALAPGLRQPDSTLYLTAALYGLNFLTYTHYSLILIGGVAAGVASPLGRVSRGLAVTDVQATMLLLGLVWLATMGAL
jgi:hypothetical protein